MINMNIDFIAALQRKIIGRYQTGSGHQIAAMGKRTFTEKELRQLIMFPFHLTDGNPAFKHQALVSSDLKADFRFR